MQSPAHPSRLPLPRPPPLVMSPSRWSTLVDYPQASLEVSASPAYGHQVTSRSMVQNPGRDSPPSLLRSRPIWPSFTTTSSTLKAIIHDYIPSSPPYYRAFDLATSLKSHPKPASAEINSAIMAFPPLRHYHWRRVTILPLLWPP
jgi:hypothetical protein